MKPTKPVMVTALAKAAEAEALQALGAVILRERARAMLPGLRQKLESLRAQTPGLEAAIPQAEALLVERQAAVAKWQGELATLRVNSANWQRADHEKSDSLLLELNRALTLLAECNAGPHLRRKALEGHLARVGELEATIAELERAAGAPLDADDGDVLHVLSEALA